MNILLSEDEVRRGVARLAQAITQHYQDTPVTVVGVLTGSLVLVADLVRHLEMPLRIALLQASSYRGKSTRPAELVVEAPSFPPLTNQHVLLVDDIFDTGHTLAALTDQIQSMQPATFRSAVLLRKLGRQEVEVEPDYWAFEIPDKFVVGYGLDYNDLYRNLPYVAVMTDADLEGQ